MRLSAFVRTYFLICSILSAGTEDSGTLNDYDEPLPKLKKKSTYKKAKEYASKKLDSVKKDIKPILKTGKKTLKSAAGKVDRYVHKTKYEREVNRFAEGKENKERNKLILEITANRGIDHSWSQIVKYSMDVPHLVATVLPLGLTESEEPTMSDYVKTSLRALESTLR